MRSEILIFLKSVSLFKGLGVATLEAIYRQIKELSFSGNDYIYQSGDPSSHLYIVRYGEVIVRLGSGGEKFRYIGQGEVFSEQSILTKSLHYGTAQAVLDTILYAIDGHTFLELAEKNKKVSQNLLRLIGSRMKDSLSPSIESLFARRLICHIPLEEMEHYAYNLKEIIRTGELSLGRPMKLLNISEFGKMSPNQAVSALAALRRKYSILHVYYDYAADACVSPNNILMQADQIVLWEQSQEDLNDRKKDLVQSLRKCVRSFDKRSIRMIESGYALQRQSYGGQSKVFIRKETLSRFLISKTRGLALGGGAARSFAHIGMIKVLEEEGITIDYISGCSFGAIIGALYARGENYASMMKIMKQFFGVLKRPILDARLPLVSFYKGARMEQMVREAFGDQKIEDLYIPFVTSAVDLQSGKEYVFDKGPIWEALVCCMSLPGIFPPRFVGSHLLADGGTLNNVPDNLIRAKGASIILSVNVAPLEDFTMVKLLEPKNLRKKLSIRDAWENITHPPILKIITRAVNLEGRELIRMRTKNMDYFINFNLDQFSLFDFKNYKKIVASGEKQFREYLPGVTKLFFPGRKKR
ncbi:MAG: patatin-like phospholipase family protein [Spirochaetia bacterium]|nr:patatin-like phospholipase family protein [Spirochaetia bacterium]